MPYIGKQPLTGAYQLCDTITTSATATYNLLVGGSAVIPGSANNCIVSLNGVVQAPVGAFTVSGSTITFASTLSSSDVIDFILILGNVFDIGTPTNGSVTNSSLNSNVITGQSAETSVAGDDLVLLYDNSATALRKMTRTNFVAGIGGTNTPAFKAYLSTGQSISNNSNTKVTFQTELYDTNSCYDNSTNYRFTPTTAGKYFFTTKVRFETGSASNNAQLRIVKNGNSSDAAPPNAVYTNSYNLAYSYMVVSGALEANGTTDYFEVFAYQDTGGAVNISASFGASFEGFKIIE
jgi:hypothetical protein